MKVLYLSQTEDLQIIEIEDLLDRFLKNGSTSQLLKDIVFSLDAQGFYIGTWGAGSFSIMNFNLPKNNILILSNGELNYLYNHAVVAAGKLLGDESSIHSANAWAKIGELVAGMNKAKKEEKEDA